VILTLLSVWAARSGLATAAVRAVVQLVLVGLLAAETVTVVVTQQLIAARRVMPADIRATLPP